MDQDKEQNKEAEITVQLESSVGFNSEYVKLVASDGHEFIIKREYAILSGRLNAMLNDPGQFSENETNTIHLPTISAEILQKVCMYLACKSNYNKHQGEVPEFPVSPHIAMDLLMAANFLDC